MKTTTLNTIIKVFQNYSSLKFFELQCVQKVTVHLSLILKLQVHSYFLNALYVRRCLNLCSYSTYVTWYKLVKLLYNYRQYITVFTCLLIHNRVMRKVQSRESIACFLPAYFRIAAYFGRISE